MPHPSATKLSIPIVALLFTIASAHVPTWCAPQEQASGPGPRVDRGDAITDEQRKEIEERLDRTAAMLQAEGLLPPPMSPFVATHPTLIWPVIAPTLNDPDFHQLLAFVDHDPNYPGFLKDYNCGTRTYDNATGYNHQGTDYGIWPFKWLRMDQSRVIAVAAAPGTILGKDDGHPDHSCDNVTEAPWNAVYLQHADGSRTWYGHLQLNSLTTKPVGAAVVAGEYLGLVGSAGRSNQPHLHFEVYDSTGALGDPYQGTCNTWSATSWWASQRPYYDSGVNRVATGFALPIFPPCPQDETPNETNDFNPGDRVAFVSYYRDIAPGQSTTTTVRRPDGTVFLTATDNAPNPEQDSWYFSHSTANNTFPVSAALGVWRFDVSYLGKTYSHHFRLTAAGAGSGRVPGDFETDDPLLVARSGSSITLSWQPSCVPTDTDYEIYEGSIGTWTSHVPVACSTAGATTATIAPSAGSSYYLVVPTDSTHEGSYGFTGAWAERPVGTTSCYPQMFGGSCPHCGDFVVESPEVCDHNLLNGQTCQTLGFTDGTLACASDCRSFDTSQCF